METSNHNFKSTCLPLPSERDKKTPHDADLQSSRQWCIIQEGFPPGFTVDELKKHRKRPQENCKKPVDNLSVEKGNLNLLKTEYNRRYVPPPPEYFTQRTSRLYASEEWSQQQRGTHSQPMAEYKDKFSEFPRERPRPSKPESNLKSVNVPMDLTTEKLEKYIPFSNVERTKSLRRNTALKLEGDLLTETEMRGEFRPHGSLDRVRALKKPPTLKLEGLFETLNSEQKDKYIAYLANRTPLLKREDQLKLDGELNLNTECKDKYVYLGYQERAGLRKKSTSLKLLGEVDLTPEYRRSFTDLPRCRPAPTPHPPSQLQPQTQLDFGMSESRSQFMPIPLTQIPSSAKYNDNIPLHGEMSLIPEYQEKFILHGKSKSEIIRKQDNLHLEGGTVYETEHSKYTPSCAFRQPNHNLNNSSSSFKSLPSASLSNSEYNSQFVDFPRTRPPPVPRPLANLNSTTETPADNMTTESSQYHSHGYVPRTTPRKRSPTLKPDGGILGEAEYKNKYIQYPVSYNKIPKPPDSFSQEHNSFNVIDEPISPLNVEPLQPYDPAPSYRLEVHPMDKSPGFHKSPQRVFAQEALVSNGVGSKENHEAAIESAMRRRKSYEKRASGGGDLGGRSANPLANSKLQLDENGNEPPFVVLDKPSRFIPTTIPSS